MRKIQFEVKSLEQALELAVPELRVSKDKIKLEIIKEKKSLLKGKTLTVEARIDEDIIDVIYNYLKDMLEGMDIDYSIDIKNNENSTTFSIQTDNNPLLIGREGKTLNAIQFMCKQIMYIYSDEKINFNVDIGGYKDNRILQLEMLATRTAKEVARTKIEAILDPMNSYERRIVHAKLSEWRDVYTESVGEDPNRCLVIKAR
ncbi:KH domain-containing protein [Mycoplasmatota bacterium]|nr:KH domain-containing protein [Mycoplasmatota bacterium]